MDRPLRDSLDKLARVYAAAALLEACAGAARALMDEAEPEQRGPAALASAVVLNCAAEVVTRSLEEVA